jgi:hypothetical protein
MCVLRVTGTQFDADKYLEVSGLEAIKVFRRGEPRFASKPDGKQLGFSGFNVAVSDAPWDGIGGQITDAIAFLKENGDAVRMLRAAPGVEDVRLDFPLDLRIDRVNIMSQFDYLSPELVSLAGALGLGIEISIYPRDLEALARGTTEEAG